jgi:hypothetical protein
LSGDAGELLADVFRDEGSGKLTEVSVGDPLDRGGGDIRAAPGKDLPECAWVDVCVSRGDAAGDPGIRVDRVAPPGPVTAQCPADGDVGLRVEEVRHLNRKREVDGHGLQVHADHRRCAQREPPAVWESRQTV